MKALLVSQPNKFAWVDMPRPVCGPGQVVIRTAYCGICGTDIDILRGKVPALFVRYPVVPGHEWTGTVVEVGPGVTNCAINSRVMAVGYLNCGVCAHCRAGEVNHCEVHEQIGFTQNGGFAEFVVAPARCCLVIADTIGLDEAVMAEPAATVVRAIDRASPKPGLKAAVIGCGPIGQTAIRALGLYAPSAILGIDLSPMQESLARRAGTTSFVSTSDTAEMVSMSGADGWDVVIECAGGPQALETALTIVRPAGHVAIIGASSDDQVLSLPANIFYKKDLRIDGILSYTPESFRHALDLLASGRLRLKDLITHRLPFEKFTIAVELLAARAEPLGKVMVGRCD